MGARESSPTVQPAHSVVRSVALVVASGFAAIAVFQLALIVGAPLGRAAWGGDGTVLPTSLRLASVVAIVVYGVGAGIILRRAGLPIRWISPRVARRGTWVLVVLLTVSAAGNFLSESPWERFLMAPTALLLGALTLVVARSPEETDTALPVGAGSPSSEQPELSTTAHS
jgi:hypothetical protein